MMYNWQKPDWPFFSYDHSKMEGLVYAFAAGTGKLSGVLKGLPENTRMEAVIDAMVSEAIKTSEIEGEFFSREDIRSSIRNTLGLNAQPEPVKDKKAGGIGKLMVVVRNSFSEPLTEENLFEWHSLLLPGSDGIVVGAWRRHEEPMQVVSGPLGKQRVHFEAPPSTRVPGEMKGFISWFNETAPGGSREIRGPVRAAIAHLYFESIHPFEDGNGRIGRAIAEKALSQALGHPVFMSLSASIEAKKKDYYAALEKAQRSNEVTAWVFYFLETIVEAIKEAEQQVDFILGKALYFEQHKNRLNNRQLLVSRRMLEEGPKGFRGGMSAKKYVSLTYTSKATATRDLQQLAEVGAFKPIGSGRSARYEIILPGFTFPEP